MHGKVGEVPGIYGTWDECKMQVDIHSEYKGFRNHEAKPYASSESSKA